MPDSVRKVTACSVPGHHRKLKQQSQVDLNSIFFAFWEEFHPDKTCEPKTTAEWEQHYSATWV